MFFWRIFTFVKWSLLPISVGAFIIAPEAFPVCLAEWRDGFAETFSGYTERGYFAPQVKEPI
jgi:hypothetical protein|tara:strand:+ start:1822 stop:2007 length:186 start_codon:yes stop_codon:yes gene_type:complete